MRASTPHRADESSLGSSPRPPWRPRVGIDAVVEDWLSSGYVRPCLAADRELAAEPGSSLPLPDDVRPELRAALAARGIDQLYAHQAEAIAAARAKRHVVIAT